MIPFLILMFSSLRSIWDTARDPKVRPLAVWLGIFLVIGATFYHNVEGWGWLDAFYFSVIALATVGFGDFTPETAAGKVFTIFYVLGGIGILLAFIDAVTKRETERRIYRSRQEEPHEGVSRSVSESTPAVDER